MSSLYISGIHILGDANEIMNKFDTDIEKLDEDLFKGNIKPEDIDKSKARLENLKKRRLSYMRIKSAISLLFTEIMSNEKVVYQIFDEELVLRIALLEPYFDFALNDVNSNVDNSFFKRNFKPLINSGSINPYYIHFKEQELSSDESKYIATVLSTLIHPNMKSIVAVAGILNFENFDLAIKSLKYNYLDSLDIYNNIIISMKDRIKGICSQESSSLPKEIVEKIESINSIADMEDLSELKTLLEDVFAKDMESYYNTSIDRIYNAVENAISSTKWIRSCRNTMERMVVRMYEIINNIASEEFKQSGRVSYSEGKPVLNFWPLTQSYEYDISKINNDHEYSNIISALPEGSEEDNVLPDGYVERLEPGDVIHQRYSRRYSITNPDH